MKGGNEKNAHRINAAYDKAEENFEQSLTIKPLFAFGLEHLAELEGDLDCDELAYDLSLQLISWLEGDRPILGMPPDIPMNTHISYL